MKKMKAKHELMDLKNGARARRKGISECNPELLRKAKIRRLRCVTETFHCIRRLPDNGDARQKLRSLERLLSSPLKMQRKLWRKLWRKSRRSETHVKEQRVLRGGWVVNSKSRRHFRAAFNVGRESTRRRSLLFVELRVLNH